MLVEFNGAKSKWTKKQFFDRVGRECNHAGGRMMSRALSHLTTVRPFNAQDGPPPMPPPPRDADDTRGLRLGGYTARLRSLVRVTSWMILTSNPTPAHITLVSLVFPLAMVFLLPTFRIIVALDSTILRLHLVLAISTEWILKWLILDRMVILLSFASPFDLQMVLVASQLASRLLELLLRLWFDKKYLLSLLFHAPKPGTWKRKKRTATQHKRLFGTLV